MKSGPLENKEKLHNVPVRGVTHSRLKKYAKREGFKMNFVGDLAINAFLDTQTAARKEADAN